MRNRASDRRSESTLGSGRGFTLIELLVVIAVIAVLGSLSIGTTAFAVGNGKPNGGGPNGTGPPGYTGIYTPCPHTGYTSRPCGHGNGLDQHK